MLQDIPLPDGPTEYLFYVLGGIVVFTGLILVVVWLRGTRRDDKGNQGTQDTQGTQSTAKKDAKQDNGTAESATHQADFEDES